MSIICYRNVDTWNANGLMRRVDASLMEVIPWWCVDVCLEYVKE
jgi:hypothetical protein